MRTKDLEQLIKSEANKTVIPDVSINIKEKLENHQKPQVISTSKQERRSFRLVFRLSLSLLLIMFISLGIFRLQTANPIDDDSIVDAVVLSTVASSQVAINTLSSDDGLVLLANGNGNGGSSGGSNQSGDEIIETDVDHLTKYLGVVEQMMSSMQNMQVQKKRMNAISRQYKLTFSTSNLEDEMTDYELKYQEIDSNNDVYQLSGQIIKNNITYQMEISYNKKSKTVTSKTYETKARYVEVEYVKKGSVYQYSVSSYNSDVLDETIEISYEGMHQVTLRFINSEASGTYQFEISKGMMNRRYLQVGYSVDGAVGEMKIEVSQTNKGEYIIEVSPSNGHSFTVTKSRKNK